MNLRVDNCKSYGSGFLEFYCNGVNVRDCWLAWDVAATTWDGGPLFLGNDKLSCVGLCEVPFGTNTNQHPRFQTPPAVFPTEDVLAVTCTDCRFGGEATQTPIMYVRCKGSSLCLNQTAVFGVADGYWLKCDQMPELISVRNCVGDGFVNTWGVWFNSSTITATDIPGLCQIDVDCKTSYTSAYEAFLSASSVVRGGSRFPFVPSQRQFMSGGVQRNICIGDGITWWGAPYTSGSANAGFGGVTPLLGYNLGLISFSGEGYYGIKMPGFNPGVAGVYTFSVVVRTSSRAAWQFVANDGGAIIANGVCDGGVQKIICKFYHSGSGSTTPVFLINGSSGDSHVVGLLKIEAGSTASDFVTPGYTGEPGQLRQFFGSAAPTNGTWRVGDAVINSAPAVGSPKGWRCTVAGTPGTWVSEGNL
jgi:hypothetical protein